MLPAPKYMIMGVEVSRYEIRLANFIEALHAHVTGTSDPMRPRDARHTYLCLKARLDDWTPNNFPPAEKYEAAFKLLLEAAIEEYESHWSFKHDLEDFEKENAQCS